MCRISSPLSGNALFARPNFLIINRVFNERTRSDSSIVGKIENSTFSFCARSLFVCAQFVCERVRPCRRRAQLCFIVRLVPRPDIHHILRPAIFHFISVFSHTHSESVSTPTHAQIRITHIRFRLTLCNSTGQRDAVYASLPHICHIFATYFSSLSLLLCCCAKINQNADWISTRLGYAMLLPFVQCSGAASR